MGCYKYPREFNWLTGACCSSSPSEWIHRQLLRWDQNAVCRVVAAEQSARVPVLGPYVAHFLLAGRTLGGATLSRFFAFHVFSFPRSSSRSSRFICIWFFMTDFGATQARRGCRSEYLYSRYEALLDRSGVRSGPMLRGATRWLRAGGVRDRRTRDDLRSAGARRPPDPSMLAKDPAPDCICCGTTGAALIPRGLPTHS